MKVAGTAYAPWAAITLAEPPCGAQELPFQQDANSCGGVAVTPFVNGRGVYSVHAAHGCAPLLVIDACVHRVLAHAHLARHIAAVRPLAICRLAAKEHRPFIPKLRDPCRFARGQRPDVCSSVNRAFFTLPPSKHSHRILFWQSFQGSGQAHSRLRRPRRVAVLPVPSDFIAIERSCPMRTYRRRRERPRRGILRRRREFPSPCRSTALRTLGVRNRY